MFSLDFPLVFCYTVTMDPNTTNSTALWCLPQDSNIIYDYAGDTRVKAVEFYPNGTIKRIEYRD